MDHWRLKAIDLFPERKREFCNTSLTFSIYALFYEDMLEMWENAAKANDLELAQRILNLVEWGLSDDDYNVRNATTVSFLEHIPDVPSRLFLAERIMPEHLFILVIEASAYLRKRDKTWRLYLEESVGRYNNLHQTDVIIKWP